MTNRVPFSRRDARPRHAVQPHDPEKWLPVFGQDHAQKTVNHFAEHHRVTPTPAVGPAFSSMMPALYWSMIFSENRYPLFRIMLDK
jgi:hypothetical protein